MDPKDKKELSEIDICDLFITPAVKDAGWDQLRQIRREVTLTPGPVIVRDNMSSRNKKKKKFADYVLQWEAGVPIAVIEAKDNNHSVSHGMQQALGYTNILNVPSAFSSNGDAFASHNKVPEPGEDIECELPRLQLAILPNNRLSSPWVNRPFSLLLYDINFNRKVKTIPFEPNRNN